MVHDRERRGWGGFFPRLVRLSLVRPSLCLVSLSLTLCLCLCLCVDVCEWCAAVVVVVAAAAAGGGRREGSSAAGSPVVVHPVCRRSRMLDTKITLLQKSGSIHSWTTEPPRSEFCHPLSSSNWLSPPSFPSTHMSMDPYHHTFWDGWSERSLPPPARRFEW